MTERNRIPVIGVPLGDPNGIGPEIAVKAALAFKGGDCTLLLVGDHWLAEKALRLDPAGRQTSIRVVPQIRGGEALEVRPEGINVLDVQAMDPAKLTPGVVSSHSGEASLSYTRQAVALALAGTVAGIACAPSNKESMKLAGSEFKGQTEFIGSLSAAPRVDTVLVSGKFRVFQLTTHVPLREACGRITEDRVLQGIRVFNAALGDFGISDPLIAVCGLNPHSGDGGLLGSEEKEHIVPAIERASSAGLRLDGPVPGDMVFAKVRKEGHDGILAMYHDQANAVLKFISDPVSVTIGLPIIRTTVGHGTAYDIAWRGTADPACMKAAVEVAAALARARRSRGD